MNYLSPQERLMPVRRPQTCTGSITEAAFEDARAQVREDGASGAVEAEESRLAKKAPGASKEKKKEEGRRRWIL